jgi:hypothetical protein
MTMWSSIQDREAHKDSRNICFVVLWFLYNLLQIFEVQLNSKNLNKRNEIEKTQSGCWAESSPQAGRSWAKWIGSTQRLGPLPPSVCWPRRGARRTEEAARAAGLPVARGSSDGHHEDEVSMMQLFLQLRRVQGSLYLASGRGTLGGSGDGGVAALRRPVEAETAQESHGVRYSMGRQIQFGGRSRGKVARRRYRMLGQN